MADAREVLETMKKVAQVRIDMLKEGVTFHDQYKQEFYLREYEDKVKQIDDLIRRMNIRLVYSRSHEGSDTIPET
jgi:hypothetical protein